MTNQSQLWSAVLIGKWQCTELYCLIGQNDQPTVCLADHFVCCCVCQWSAVILCSAANQLLEIASHLLVYVY